MRFFKFLKALVTDIEEDKYIRVILLSTVFFAFLLFFLCNYFFGTTSEQYKLLAQSFLEGKLYFKYKPSDTLGWIDVSFYNKRNYWPLGLFPAVFLTPLVWLFGDGLQQGQVAFILTLVSFFIFKSIFSKLTGSKNKGLLLSFSYIFSTAYIGVAMFVASWQFAHVISTTALAFSLYFVFVKDKPVVSGTFFAAAFLSRMSIGFGGLFYLFYYLTTIKSTKERTKDLIRWFLPGFLGILVFFSYNYLRFENVLETGYSMQKIEPELSSNRELGMWSFRHFLTNIYLFVLSGPTPHYIENTYILSHFSADKMGMSFIFTSPILLFLFLANMKERTNKLALFGAAPIMIFLFGSFGLGIYQYGYRFALDFQPFLFLILCSVFRKRRVTYALVFFLILSFGFNTHLYLNNFVPEMDAYVAELSEKFYVGEN